MGKDEQAFRQCVYDHPGKQAECDIGDRGYRRDDGQNLVRAADIKSGKGYHGIKQRIAQHQQACENQKDMRLKVAGYQMAGYQTCCFPVILHI